MKKIMDLNALKINQIKLKNLNIIVLNVKNTYVKNVVQIIHVGIIILLFWII